MKICSKCHIEKELQEFYTDSSKSGRRYICKTCDKKRIKDIQLQYKLRCLDYKGGAFCIECGYDKCVAALEFHHLDRSEKEFHIGMGRKKFQWEATIKELDKCIVLCANCHREAHNS